MHCHEAQRRLTETGSNAEALRDDAPLQAHLATCEACAHAAEATLSIKRAFDATREQDCRDMPAFDQVRRQVEADVSADHSSVRGNKSIMAKLWNPLSGRTRWSIGLVTATAVLAFLTLVPFNYKRTVGYEVALAGVDKNLAMDEGKIRVLLDKLGVDRASIELGECEATCNLTIADLESRDHCKMIIAAMQEMGSCEIVNEGEAQFVLAKGVLVELAANNLPFGERAALGDHEVFELVHERLGENFKGEMNIFVTKEGEAGLGDYRAAFGSGTIRGCSEDGQNFAFQCCEIDSAECAAVLDCLSLEEGFDGSSSECTFIYKADDSRVEHLNELLAGAGIDFASIQGDIDQETLAKLAELGLSIVVLDDLHEDSQTEGDHLHTTREFTLKRDHLDSGIDSEDAAAKAGVVPDGYALNQNYPNPFNPQTTIRFSLAQSGRVRIDIINIMGRTVRTLKDETMSAGIHKVVWDATSDDGIKVPSGTYMYRIEAGDFVDTKTMTLLK